jgi:glycosyltransferase involved in cell wall biosynthesis
MVCTSQDGAELVRLYGAPASRIIEVPNGSDVRDVNYVSLNDRLAAKSRLGLDGAFLALFMGSWHPPNIEAVRRILGFARTLPQVNSLIVGSAGLAFGGQSHPQNVGFMGEVDEETKQIVLSIADVALNPMESGSGTNLKMLEYCAAGIPVVSTPYGIRGLELENGVHVSVANIERFPDALIETKNAGKGLSQRLEQARRIVESRYDWSGIVRRLLDELEAKGLLSSIEDRRAAAAPSC